MQQAATYRQRSRELLAKARAELDTDLAQAGEKGWGATASIIKAFAEQRGLYHRTHRALHDIVGSMVEETGDAKFGVLFGAATGLHTNFYENWSNRTVVETGIQAVERFVTRVEILLNSSP